MYVCEWGIRCVTNRSLQAHTPARFKWFLHLNKHIYWNLPIHQGITHRATCVLIKKTHQDSSFFVFLVNLRFYMTKWQIYVKTQHHHQIPHHHRFRALVNQQSSQPFSQQFNQQLIIWPPIDAIRYRTSWWTIQHRLKPTICFSHLVNRTVRKVTTRWPARRWVNWPQVKRTPAII